MNGDEDENKDDDGDGVGDDGSHFDQSRFQACI